MRCVTGLRPRNRRSTAIRSRNTPMDSLLSVVALGHRVSTRNGAHLGGDDQRRSGPTIVSRASAALGVPRSHHRSCRGAASFNPHYPTLTVSNLQSYFPDIPVTRKVKDMVPAGKVDVWSVTGHAG